MARRVRRIVYVSCSPGALARDLDVLAAHGMQLVGLEALDLFPQTAEVETVAVLERAAPLDRWNTPGGYATHPWGDRPSGALGRADELTALVIGDPGPRGEVRGASWKRLGLVAGHGLLSIRLSGPPARRWRVGVRPSSGRCSRADAAVLKKAGLLRPFLHVSRADGPVLRCTATCTPLHCWGCSTLLGAPVRVRKPSAGPQYRRATKPAPPGRVWPEGPRAGPAKMTSARPSAFRSRSAGPTAGSRPGIAYSIDVAGVSRRSASSASTAPAMGLGGCRPPA